MKLLHRFAIVLIFVIITAAGIARAAVTVTVTTGTVHQTIDGMGAFGGKVPWWEGAPFYDDRFLSVVVDSIGMTLMRLEFFPKPEDEAIYTSQISLYKAYLKKAEEAGEPMKLFASIWSPPGRFKTNNSAKGGGSLNMGMVGAFGDYVVEYLRDFKEQMGVDLYAIGLQNEPQLGTGYNSCT